MIYVALTADGKRFELPIPVSVAIQKSEDAPADGFSGVFAEQELPACTFFQIYNGENLLFDGLIDSQIWEDQQDRKVLKIEARNKVALLLDNEALPQTYQNPSLSMLFSRHAAPYGFQYAGLDRTVTGTMTVSKGMSEWQVLEQFCSSFLGVPLQVGGDGILYTGERNLPLAEFGGDRTPFLLRTIRFRNSVLYSRLIIKSTKDKTWTGYMEDLSAQHLGIRRVRYLNTDADARQIIRKANRRYLEITLWCPGCVTPEIGAPAQLIGIEKTWNGAVSVAGWSYQFSAGQESTRVTLRADQ